MNLLEVLKAGKKNIKTLNFPGTDQKIGLTVLTDGEVQESVFSAERYFKDKGMEISASTLSTYNAEINTQMLFRAIVDPEKRKSDGTYEQAFKRIEDLRLASSAQKAQLVEEYNDFEAQCSPSVETMPDEEFDKLFEDIKKNPLTGNSLNLSTAKRLIAFLASRQQNSPKGNGSIS